jgi:hypothetical protein
MRCISICDGPLNAQGHWCVCYRRGGAEQWRAGCLHCCRIIRLSLRLLNSLRLLWIPINSKHPDGTAFATDLPPVAAVLPATSSAVDLSRSGVNGVSAAGGAALSSGEAAVCAAATSTGSDCTAVSSRCGSGAIAAHVPTHPAFLDRFASSAFRESSTMLHECHNASPFLLTASLDFCTYGIGLSKRNFAVNRAVFACSLAPLHTHGGASTELPPQNKCAADTWCCAT